MSSEKSLDAPLPAGSSKASTPLLDASSFSSSARTASASSLPPLTLPQLSTVTGAADAAVLAAVDPSASPEDTRLQLASMMSQAIKDALHHRDQLLLSLRVIAQVELGQKNLAAAAAAAAAALAPPLSLPVSLVEEADSVSEASEVDDFVQCFNRQLSSSSALPVSAPTPSDSLAAPSSPSAVAERTLVSISSYRLVPPESVEFLVQWSAGPDTYESFDSVGETVGGMIAMRAYYNRMQPADIWLDAMKEREYESLEMVAHLARLKRLLPADNHAIMAEFQQVENSLRNIAVHTTMAASFATQTALLRWRITLLHVLTEVLEELPAGEYFRTYAEFKAKSEQVWLRRQDQSARTFLEEARQQRIASNPHQDPSRNDD